MPTLEKVTIFDTTLRDGIQGAGSDMSYDNKLKVAAALEEAGVDVIEAGFPAANAETAQVVAEIAKRSTGATICALARGLDSDVRKAAAALAPAGERGRIHVFVATDSNHMSKKLNRTPEQVLEMIRENVTLACSFVSEVQYSPEVATTSDFDFLCECVRVAISSGATIINIADTVGVCVGSQYSDLLVRLQQAVPELANVVLSAHCHDDFGMATANTLAAVQAGARQVECTINGLGERAGNTALEEVVVALKVHSEVFRVQHSFDTTRLCELSKLTANASGVTVAPNKAVVGMNAFAHESGIHQDGTLKDSSLYEAFPPEFVGGVRLLPVGALSGRKGIEAALIAAGVTPTQNQLAQVCDLFGQRVTSESDGVALLLRCAKELCLCD